MPKLAPLRNCAECGTPVGRRWKDYTLCGSCTRKIMTGSEKKKEAKEDPIPY